MLTYITKALFVFDFKKYADRLFRKRSSHGPMLAYLMLHLQVGIRTQTRTEIAILSIYDAFQTKTEHFWTKKGTFWAIKVRKQPTKQLKAHILENRRHPELPGDMGKI